ncbi:unnamed protein product [Protopolystoma xenopodis]|uniref:SPIN90/Ldb17 leucine-rich domain-containing protein n=1 Tax=Protopolystoma xenopodis TaxID=117903 RepID=A0A448WBV7_9PLAT|nr:unnamed protein product [Protopolystoma xenopodis]
MAPLNDDAGETFDNVPSQCSEPGNHEYSGRGHRTRYSEENSNSGGIIDSYYSSIASHQAPLLNDASLNDHSSHHLADGNSSNCGSNSEAASIEETGPRNAVRRVLCDLFSSPETSDLVYRNDVDVIVDVINRYICDLPSDSLVSRIK